MLASVSTAALNTCI